MPDDPQTLLWLEAVGQGVEKASLFGIGERRNGCDFRSPGDEYEDAVCE
jgi:hypothetical protein